MTWFHSALPLQHWVITCWCERHSGRGWGWERQTADGCGKLLEERTIWSNADGDDPFFLAVESRPGSFSKLKSNAEGVELAKQKWCARNFLTFETKLVSQKYVYFLLPTVLPGAERGKTSVCSAGFTINSLFAMSPVLSHRPVCRLVINQKPVEGSIKHTTCKYRHFPQRRSELQPVASQLKSLKAIHQVFSATLLPLNCRVGWKKCVIVFEI